MGCAGSVSKQSLHDELEATERELDTERRRLQEKDLQIASVSECLQRQLLASEQESAKSRSVDDLRSELQAKQQLHAEALRTQKERLCKHHEEELHTTLKAREEELSRSLGVQEERAQAEAASRCEAEEVAKAEVAARMSEVEAAAQKQAQRHRAEVEAARSELQMLKSQTAVRGSRRAMLTLLARSRWRFFGPEHACAVRVQRRFFAREPADGTQGFKRFYEQVQEYKADESRLRDGWAWIGFVEHKLEETKLKATKIRRKLRYPNDAEGQAKKAEQQKYWEDVKVAPLRAEHVEATEMLREARKSLKSEQEERASGRHATALEDRLAEAHREHERAEQRHGDVTSFFKVQLRDLHEELQTRAEDLRERDAVVLRRDQELDEVNGQLKDLQGLFDEVNGQLQHECGRIERLQGAVTQCAKQAKELDSLQNMLEESHRMLAQLRETLEKERAERMRVASLLEHEQQRTQLLLDVLKHFKEKLQGLTPQMLLSRLGVNDPKALLSSPTLNKLISEASSDLAPVLNGLENSSMSDMKSSARAPHGSMSPWGPPRGPGLACRGAAAESPWRAPTAAFEAPPEPCVPVSQKQLRPTGASAAPQTGVARRES
ncbi:unnamed protein product [Symbiodinium sp. CCMP2592]|nr:unnamed protein product [Symbiodinium sp. CCMP2592]